jgi:ATP/maltotriose-dependent transcriptional regulator MalT
VLESLSVLSWSELRLTLEESEAVAAAQGVSDAALAKRLHAQTDGWFAGLALLVERAKRGEPSRGAVRAEAMEIVFDFFAQVIFERAPEPVQMMLLRAAQLPRATASLVQWITGTDAAGEHLEALSRRHLFVERTSDPVPTYQFHALFRAFLRHRAQIVLSKDERVRIARTAAIALEESGAQEDAFALWVDAEDWPAAKRTLIAAAPALLAQGRWRILVEWIDALPARLSGADPWIHYWRGRAMVFEDRVAVACTARERIRDVLRGKRQRGTTAVRCRGSGGSVLPLPRLRGNGCLDRTDRRAA